MARFVGNRWPLYPRPSPIEKDQATPLITTGHFSLTSNQSEGLVFFQEVPLDINAPNVVLKMQKIPYSWKGVGESNKFYGILLQEMPENASNLVLKLQMLFTLGGGQSPLLDPPPAWSLRSLAVKASFCCFIVLHIFHPMPFCAPPPPPPGKKFLDPPLMPIPLELRGLRPLNPTGALPPPPPNVFAHYATAKTYMHSIWLHNKTSL